MNRSWTALRAVWMLVMLALAPSVKCAWIEGRVVGVHDGDTLTVLTPENVQVKVRLAGIDAPELKQPFSTASKQALSDLVFGKAVKVEDTGHDQYKRTLGNVYVGQVWVNLALLRQGLAWFYVQYSKDPQLRSAEALAKAEHRGLWADPTAVAPWLWRKAKKGG